MYLCPVISLTVLIKGVSVTKISKYGFDRISFFKMADEVSFSFTELSVVFALYLQNDTFTTVLLHGAILNHVLIISGLFKQTSMVW